ncbi:MAG: YjeF N-terminal domain-containing protein [Benjaminiella poitrasii]|nr:MAG: YjeF N-terminal domain-containing protein [Benjaminiella poitrasii]
MAEVFLGLKVSVLLHSGIKLDGVVSHIDPSSHQMTLNDVTLYILGQPPHFTPIYGVIGKDIKDLQVVSAPAASAAATTIADPAMTAQPTPAIVDNHVLEQIPPPQPEKQQQQQQQLQQQQQQQMNYIRKKNGGWAGEDVNIFREEEFDFQKNLDMFDKAKVFAEIREADETAPEDLLVTLNRLPQKNLLPTENVLDIERIPLCESEVLLYNNKPKPKKRQPSVKIVTAHNPNIACPVVTPLQMARVVHECDKPAIKMNQPSYFEELALENSGRGAALLILQRLQATSVVILIGQQEKRYAVGWVIARHLMNHGCRVTVCVEKSDATSQYENTARRCGVRVCDDVQDLLDDTYDLVVDSILDSDEMSEGACDMIEWVNGQSKPILSIDFPSGVDATTGVPYQSDCTIHPKWTLCLGAPKTGCKAQEITGELYLVDIGIPRLYWKRISVKENMAPWGADFLIALEYDKK